MCDGAPWTTEEMCVSQYRRPAAAKQADDAEKNRFRQVLQEYRMQGFSPEVGRLDGAEDLHVIDNVTRWLIDADFHLRDSEPYKLLQAQQMRAVLLGVLDMLQEMYTVGLARRVGADLDAVVTSPHQDEMAAYVVLRDLSSSLHYTDTPGVRESAWVILARNVVVAYRERRYVQFFAAMRQAPYLARCLMFQVVPEMRELALATLSIGLRGD
ncbi:hypothetical protein JKP88DRAFT_283105 [Tribonema minus]|uniref:SAC3/GANP/THP3 conserved domain-containing protein n=1 Tax=Tribonema minus TaxID=303371 RepID=A0A835YT02_9STRA|nr:hypothetical protein JKP88DRAFT_283105 [Tribonema minus]